MKHLIAAAALALLAGIATAQTKVGYIDIDQITRKSKPVSGMMDKIKDEIETIQKEIASRDTKIRDLKADLKKNDGVLSTSDTDAKRKEITRLQNELDEYRVRGERKAREVDSRVLEPMLKTILFRVEDVAKEKGIDIVLRGEAVIYGTKAVDLTDDVIERLNAEGGATTGSTEARAGSRTPAAKSETTKAKPETTPAEEATPEPDSVLPLSDAPKTDEKKATATPQPERKETATGDAKKPEATKAPAGRGRAVDRQPEL